MKKREDEKTLYTVDRKDLYKEVSGDSINQSITAWENPFSIDTFPAMKDLNYSAWFKHGTLFMKRGSREAYDKAIEEHRKKWYLPADDKTMINKAIKSITVPRLYNVVTGQPIMSNISRNLIKDTRLVVKIVDLGAIYEEYMYDREEGNLQLREIYNEIRVGFFLNELRYAYPVVLTHHFMTVVDWFVSDHNLYHEEGVKMRGPFQYIISEKLDSTLYNYLTKHRNMDTLKCVLWGIAQPLEAAWATNEYLHYDLHHNNIMIKEVVDDSPFHNKNYLYTRPYSNETYLLPSKGLHNTIVKLIDFGRNRMQVPMGNNDDDKDLFQHIDKEGKHQHSNLIVYDHPNDGIGFEGNRSWDIRRFMWDLLSQFPVDYWEALKKSSSKDYDNLVTQMDELIGITGLLLSGTGSIDKILMSKTRQIRITLKYFDPGYMALDKVLKERIENGLDTEEEENACRRYRAQFSKGTEFTDTELEKNFKQYEDWHNLVQKKTIFTNINNDHNATTFLSSPLFEDFRVKTGTNIGDPENVWLGQRPGRVLLANEIYFPREPK